MVPLLAFSLQGVSRAFVEAFASLVQIVGAVVVSVGINHRHGIGKQPCVSIQLVQNLGVEGDAHFGALVQHCWLKRKDPALPNRTQVHLLHEELFDELASKGIVVTAGNLGENVTTRGVDLLQLPVGTRLCLGADAMIEVTGLREPCSQLNRVHAGLMGLLRCREAGRMVRKAGVMGIVLRDGKVQAGDTISVELPDPPWVLMGPV